MYSQNFEVFNKCSSVWNETLKRKYLSIRKGDIPVVSLNFDRWKIVASQGCPNLNVLQRIWGLRDGRLKREREREREREFVSIRIYRALADIKLWSANTTPSESLLSKLFNDSALIERHVLKSQTEESFPIN